MKIEYQRGPNTFIIKDGGNYYLIDIQKEVIREARPNNSPDMFLKFGYFEEPGKISKETEERIQTVYKQKNNRIADKIEAGADV